MAGLPCFEARIIHGKGHDQSASKQNIDLVGNAELGDRLLQNRSGGSKRISRLAIATVNAQHTPPTKNLALPQSLNLPQLRKIFSVVVQN